MRQLPEERRAILATLADAAPIYETWPDPGQPGAVCVFSAPTAVTAAQAARDPHAFCVTAAQLALRCSRPLGLVQETLKEAVRAGWVTRVVSPRQIRFGVLETHQRARLLAAARPEGLHAAILAALRQLTKEWPFRANGFPAVEVKNWAMYSRAGRPDLGTTRGALAALAAAGQVEDLGEERYIPAGWEPRRVRTIVGGGKTPEAA